MFVVVVVAHGVGLSLNERLNEKHDKRDDSAESGEKRRVAWSCATGILTSSGEWMKRYTSGGGGGAQ